MHDMHRVEQRNRLAFLVQSTLACIDLIERRAVWYSRQQLGNSSALTEPIDLPRASLPLQSARSVRTTALGSLRLVRWRPSSLACLGKQALLPALPE